MFQKIALTELITIQSNTLSIPGNLNFIRDSKSDSFTHQYKSTHRV
nr:MAG TPA: hypothetical protein [Caudoviricetes sp.]